MAAPTVPNGLVASNVQSSALDLAWTKSSNSGSSWKTMSWSGCAYGYYAAAGWLGGAGQGGSGDTLLNHEAQIGRHVSVVKRYYDFSSVPWLSATDDIRILCDGGKLSTGETVTGGRIPYLALEARLYKAAGGTFPGLPAPAGSSGDFGGGQSHDVYTGLQVGQVDVNGNVTTPGSCDAILSVMAARIKAFGKPVLWTICHEGDDLPLQSGGGNKVAAALMRATWNGSYSANAHYDEYAGMYRYIKKYFDDAGATNNVCMWAMSGWHGTNSGSLGATLYPALFPGSAWVDVVGWEPYDHAPNGSPYTGSASGFARLLNYNNWYTNLDANFLGSGSGALPRFLGETGAQYRTNGTRATTFVPSMAADAAARPKVKFVDWFARGTWANLHTNVSNVWDNPSIAGLKTALNQSVFTPNTTSAGTGVGGYKVRDGSTVISTVTGDPAAPSVHLSGLIPGSTHSLSVAATDASGPPGVDSAYSTALSVVLPSSTVGLLAAPTGFTSAPAASPPQVTLSWTAVPGATGYHIQRGTDGGAFGLAQSWPAGTTQSTSTALTTGHVYQYQICALNSAGVEGPFSTPITVDTTVATVTPLTPPTGLTYVSALVPGGSANSTVALAWTKSTDVRVVEYWVYRDTDPADPATTVPTSRVAASTATWADPVAQRPAETHSYWVLAVDGSAPPVLSTSISVVSTSAAAVNSAPIASLSLSTTSLTLPSDGSGAVYTMNASGSSDPNGDPLLYTFTINDGQAPIGPTTNPIAVRRANSPGVYTITVAVDDGHGGRDTVSQTITVGAASGLFTPYLNLPLPLNNQMYGPPGTAGAKAYWQNQIQILQTLDTAVQSFVAGYTDEQVRLVVAAMLTAGTQSGISFTYDDIAASLSATVAGRTVTTRKLADQVVNNSTTFVEVSELRQTLAANAVYRVKLFLIYDGSQAADLKLGWTVPTGATLDVLFGGASSVSTGGSGSINTTAGTAGSTPFIGAIGVGTKMIVMPEGVLVTGSTGGDVYPRFAQAAADATDLTVRAGSALFLTQVG